MFCKFVIALAIFNLWNDGAYMIIFRIQILQTFSRIVFIVPISTWFRKVQVPLSTDITVYITCIN